MQRLFILITILMGTTIAAPGQTSPATPQLVFDQFIQEEWTQTETNNARIASDFVQHLMNDHDFDYIRETFGDVPYVQHNRNMEDGIAGVVNSVQGIVKRYPEYSYDVKRIIASGDYVVFHSHITMKEKHRNNDGKGFIISDTWRLKDGRIVEHWDAIQPINGLFRFFVWMTGGKVRNSNGLF